MYNSYLIKHLFPIISNILVLISFWMMKEERVQSEAFEIGIRKREAYNIVLVNPLKDDIKQNYSKKNYNWTQKLWESVST